MTFKDLMKKFDTFSKKHKDSISLIISVLMLSVILVGFFQAKASFKQAENSEIQNKLYREQLNLTQEMLKFQYNPQILVEVISPRKHAWFTELGYEEPNYIEIYNDDFAKSQTPTGSYEQLGQAIFPLKVEFQNFGSIGTKVEKIESSNSCDSKGLRSWQMDVMKTRILPPQETIEYNMFYHWVYFDEKPTNYTFCDYNITFTFYNDFKIEQSYKIHYNPFNNSFRDAEIESYNKFIEERKEERLKIA